MRKTEYNLQKCDKSSKLITINPIDLFLYHQFVLPIEDLSLNAQISITQPNFYS